MPTQVLVDAEHALDGEAREIAEKLGDLDALDLARNVHAATGEVVSLVPYVFKKGEYVLDQAQTRLFGKSEAAVEAADAGDASKLSDLTVKELKAVAHEKGLTVPAGAKKADLVALLGA